MIYNFIDATEAAAIAAASWIGMGNEKAADNAAVEAMRIHLNTMSIDGTIVIGEGERDNAPMLYIGERVGKGGITVEIAVDPLEGTTLCAKGLEKSMVVMAIAMNGSSFLKAPDVYMNKIAVGPNIPNEAIDLNISVSENLNNIANAKGCSPSDLDVSVLKRDRHIALIDDINRTGAKVHLIDDGDVEASISTCMSQFKIDVYMGIGGAPEGVLAAAAIKALGGQFKGKLIFENQEQEARAMNMGITDIYKQYSIDDLAIGNDIIFIATGVTGGSFLSGIKVLNLNKRKFSSTSMLISNKNKTISFISKESI